MTTRNKLFGNKARGVSEWKKSRDDSTGVDFEMTSNKNMIGKTRRKTDIILRQYDNDKKWLVAVGNWGTGLKIVKKTKTKQNALNYAKKMMN